MPFINLKYCVVLCVHFLRDETAFFILKYPMTLYLVTGTQAERSHSNSIMVIKMSDLSKMEQDES